ncbi:MAG: IscA/HesB family protein [Desulfobacterales bacterium]|nr:IscA/HesB family protein [Desulfobacterales bacterium]
MFEVTPAAQQEIEAYFKHKEIKPIRIFLHEGSCCGPSLVMALDEIKQNDAVYEISNISYIIDKAFLAKAEPIKVDFDEMGFSISSQIDLQSGSCSSCSSAGSCGS